MRRRQSAAQGAAVRLGRRDVIHFWRQAPHRVHTCRAKMLKCDRDSPRAGCMWRAGLRRGGIVGRVLPYHVAQRTRDRILLAQRLRTEGLAQMLFELAYAQPAARALSGPLAPTPRYHPGPDPLGPLRALSALAFLFPCPVRRWERHVPYGLAQHAITVAKPFGPFSRQGRPKGARRMKKHADFDSAYSLSSSTDAFSAFMIFPPRRVRSCLGLSSSANWPDSLTSL